MHAPKRVTAVVDDLLSETLFTINEREIDARQYLLQQHRIQAGDEQYTLSLRTIDASLARDPFNVSARWIERATRELDGLQHPSHRNARPAAIMAAVRIVEWCRSLKERIERLSKRGKVVSLNEALQLARAMACVDVMHHALGLGTPEPGAVWSSPPSQRHAPADGEERLVLQQALSLLNGPDRSHYLWDTPARKGRVKVQKLAKKVALCTGIKPQAALRQVSDLVRRGKV